MLAERDKHMSESPKEIDVEKAVEALLPYCWEARIDGKMVKGGRYYAWRREFIEMTILEALYGSLIAFQAVIIVAEVKHLMR